MNGNALRLTTSGTVTQAVAQTLPNLILGGGGTFNLSNAANDLGTVAATGARSIVLRDSNGLTVGDVTDVGAPVAGISSTGTVDISTEAGNLILDKSVATSNASATAVTLNAGRASNAGTAAGGDLVINPGASVTVGAGGTATLYTGSLAGSGSANTLVGGTGSGRFRYGSDENTSAPNRYTKALVPGLNLIYRERPTATWAMSSSSITYGDTWDSGLWTGMVNGDTASVVAAISGGTKSTSGFYTAGSHTLTASGGGTDLAALGYSLAYAAPATLTVAQRALIVSGITASSRIYDGNNAATVSTAAVDKAGMVAGDVVNVAATGTFADKNVGANKVVTLASSYSGADKDNYVITDQTSTTANITPKTLNISGITAADKVYDGSRDAQVSLDGLQRAGLVAGDDLTVAATGQFADKNVGNAKGVQLKSTYGGADRGNYAIISQDGTTASISPKAATVSGITVEDKTYDRTPNATVNASGALVNGLVAGDTVSVAATGHFADKNAGSDKIVQLSSQYTGADVGNYTLTDQKTAKASINKLSASVSGITASNKAYDGGTAATVSTSAATIAGVLEGDAVSVLATGVFADKNAGTHDVALTVTHQGSDAGNYSYTDQATATATITPKVLTVTGVAAADKVYDGNDTATLTNAGSVTTGVDSETLGLINTGATFSSKDAGTGKTVTVNGLALQDGSGGGMASNYALAAAPVTTTASIERRTVTLDGITVADKTYDGTTNATTSGTVTLGNVVSGEQLGLNTGLLQFADPDAGVNKALTLSGYTLKDGPGAKASNYTLKSDLPSVTATINKAEIKVYANPAQKFVGFDDESNFGGTSLVGFVHGETATTAAKPDGSAGITGADGITVTRSNASENNAGTYTGVLVADTSGLAARNYIFTPVAGDYTITPADQLAVLFGSSTHTYGDASGIPTPTVKFVFKKAGQPDTVKSFEANQVTKVDDSTYTINDGTGPITVKVKLESAPGVLAGVSGAGRTPVGQYSILEADGTSPPSVNFKGLDVVGSTTVTQRGVTPDAAAGVSKVYDGTTSVDGLSMSLKNLVDNDAVTVSGQGAFASRNVGDGVPFTIAQMTLGGADAGNYYLTGGSTLDKTGNITQKEVTLAAPTATKVYDGNTAYNLTAEQLETLKSALASGDGIKSVRLAFNDKNVGSNKTLSFADLVIDDGNNDGGNYKLTTTDNTASSITRLDSVAWVGGASGNWFDPANWAGGAVPDLANVANVVIPAGVKVSFDPTKAVAPADTSQAVQVDGVGDGLGSLAISGGDLQVGAGGLKLDTLDQTGGNLAVQGASELQSATISGGTSTFTGDVEATTGWTQTGGTVAAQGNLTTAAMNVSGGSLGVDKNLNADVLNLSGGAMNVVGDLGATRVTVSQAEGGTPPTLGVTGTTTASILSVEAGSAMLGNVDVGLFGTGGSAKVTTGRFKADDATLAGDSFEANGPATVGIIKVGSQDADKNIKVTFTDSLTADDLTVDGNAASMTVEGPSTVGTATIDGGTTSFAALDVKNLEQTGGTATVKGALTGGNVAVSGGSFAAKEAAVVDSVTLSGGSTTFDKALGAKTLNVSGEGTTLKADGPSSVGTATLAGGTSTLNDLTVTDSLKQSGGTLSATGTTTVNNAQQTGGSSAFAGPLTVQGTYAQQGGETTAASAVTGGNLQLDGGTFSTTSPDAPVKFAQVAQTGGALNTAGTLEAKALYQYGGTADVAALKSDQAAFLGGASTVRGPLDAGAVSVGGDADLKVQGDATVTSLTQEGGSSSFAQALKAEDVDLSGGKLGVTGPLTVTDRLGVSGQGTTLDSQGPAKVNSLVLADATANFDQGLAVDGSIRQSSGVLGVTGDLSAGSIAQVGGALTATGATTAGSVRLAGDNTLGSLSADSIAVKGGNTTLSGDLTGGDVALSGSGALDVKGKTTADDLTVADGSSLSATGPLSASTLTQSGGSIAATEVAVAGPLIQTDGALTATGTTTARSAELAGRNMLGSLSATDSIAIKGGSTALSGDLTGGDLALSGTGALTVDGATTAADVAVAGEASLSALGPVMASTLTQSGGSMAASDLTVQGALTQSGGILAATGTTKAGTAELAGASVLNDLEASRIAITGGSANVVGNLTGGDLALSGNGVLDVAGATKAAVLTVADNAILGSTGPLTAETMTQSGGRVAATDINVAGALSQTGGALTATGTTTAQSAELAGTNALNDLKADRIAVNGGTTSLSGDLTGGDVSQSGGSLAVDGDLAVGEGRTLTQTGGSATVGGSLTGGNADLQGGSLGVSGATAVDALSVGGDARLSAAGPLSANTLTQSGGSIAATDLAVAGPLSQTGGALSATGTTTAKTAELAGDNQLNSLSADSIAVKGGNTAVTGDLTGGDVAVSGGSLGVGGATQADSLTQSGGSIAATDLTVDGPLTQTGGALSATGTTTAKTAELAGDNQLSSLSADSIAVKGGNTALTGDLTGGDVALSGSGALDVGGTTTADDLTVAGESSLSAAGPLNANTLTQSGGSIAATDVAVAGPLNQTGGALSATGTTTAKTAELAGDNQLSSLSADSIAVKGGNTAVTGDLTGGDVALSGSGGLDVGGTTTADDLTVADGSSLSAAGPLSANTLTQSGGSIAATDVAVAGPLTQTGGALSATGTTTAKTAELAGDNQLSSLSADSIAVKGGNTALTGNLTGGDVALSGTGALAVGGQTTADDLTVADGGSLTSTGPLNANTLTQSGGSIAATDLAVAGPLNQTGGALSATGTTTAKTAELAGDNQLNSLSADSVAVKGGNTALTGDLKGGNVAVSGGAMAVGGNAAVNNLSQSAGGMSFANALDVNGTLSQTGGTASVDGPARLSQASQSGGGLDLNGPVTLTGTFDQSGGTTTVRGAVQGGSVAVSQDGQFNARSAVKLDTLSVSGGRVNLDKGLSATQLNQSGGTLLASGPVNAASTNLTGGSYVETGSGTSPADPGKVTAGVTPPVTTGSPVIGNPAAPTPTTTVISGDPSLPGGGDPVNVALGDPVSGGSSGTGTASGGSEGSGASGSGESKDDADGRKAAEAAGSASATQPESATPGSATSSSTGSSAASSDATGTAAASSSAVPGASAAVTRMEVVPAAASRPAVLSVTVAPDALSRPEGFSFAVPQRVWGGESSQGVRAQLPDGKPLPSGVSFDARTQRFTVSSKADVTLPLTVVLRAASGQEVVVVIDAGG
ncbi:beta strand repeat-containing protein [Amphibiibacter pelophylacis]|uniref:YDG domain-containing protein n=1 Tax=Amphibiibacter pelophylacis TaxID=1799477 RepID=A0ACC6P052_9BURK